MRGHRWFTDDLGLAPSGKGLGHSQITKGGSRTIRGTGLPPSRLLKLACQGWFTDDSWALSNHGSAT